MCGIAYNILQNQIIKTQGENSLLSKAVGKDFKGKISPVLYLIAILSTYYHEAFSGVIYILVALMWLIPDKRIEKVFDNE
jgi:uncharacterized membrane protein